MPIRNLSFLAAVASAVMVYGTHAKAQELSIGKGTYEDRCAVCHGLGGRGDGPMASVLTPPPSNLTLLAQQNDGVYPFGRVYQVIDGRSPVTGHGTTDMPIWGGHFRAEALPATRYPGVEEEEIVQGRILGLVYYIQSLQVE